MELIQRSIIDQKLNSMEPRLLLCPRGIKMLNFKEPKLLLGQGHNEVAKQLDIQLELLKQHVYAHSKRPGSHKTEGPQAAKMSLIEVIPNIYQVMTFYLFVISICYQFTQ